MYSTFQRFLYSLKRQALFIGLVAFALLYLSSVGGFELVMLMVTRVGRTALALSMALLAAKFGFPRLDVQTQLVNGNVAVAIVMGAIIVGANL